MDRLNLKKLVLLLLLFPSTLFAQTTLSGSEEYKGAARYINNFDYDASYYCLEAILINASKGTTAKSSFDPHFKYQGNGSLKCNFRFSGNKRSENPEVIRLQKVWNHNFRSDLSFYPVGISFWLHGEGSNNRLTVNLLQQDDSFTLAKDQLYTFTFSDDNILKKKGWQQVFIPYEKFVPGGDNPGTVLNLSRVNGYSFDIENVSGKPHEGVLHIDALEQLTSYNPDTEPVRFTSIFIQLHPTHHLDYDWKNLFESYMELGIDTVIVQRSALGSKEVDSATFYYKTDKIQWKIKEYGIIDQMFEGAEKTGMKLILGLHGGRYPLDKGDAAAYDKLFEKNVTLIDDLYDKFGDHGAMAGWYICEEFHDGSYRGWWKDEDRMLLAHYQQRVASYAKSKPNKYIVAIAPALWRGRPADMTYHFFKTFFENAPDIDILYLQDCGGRCSVDDGDFDVVLPLWYSYIKQACDETGVQFGVDIESFKRCGSENIRWHGKKWENLKDQLIYAGLFTRNISQFSWHSFRPGVGAFDEYKEYLRKNGMLRSQLTFQINKSEVAREPYDLYLLIGQSNMAGRGFIEGEDTITHPRVLVLDATDSFVLAKEPLHYDKANRGTGPGLAFGKKMASFYPRLTIGLIPAAVGGTKVSYWQPGGERGLYEEALRKARVALTHGVLKGIVWQQGESDSNNTDAPHYKERLLRLLIQLRKDLGDETIPIVLGGVPDFLKSKLYPTINEALKEVATEMSNVRFSEASQLGHIGDQLHFNSAAQRENGGNMAEQMIKLQLKNR